MLASPLNSIPIKTVLYKLWYFHRASYACKLQCERNFVRWSIGIFQGPMKFAFFTRLAMYVDGFVNPISFEVQLAFTRAPS